MTSENPLSAKKAEATPRLDRSKSSRSSLPPEAVEDRENVGIVHPEDYPLSDRKDGDATGNRGKRASQDGGPAKGSGAGAGGGGSPEDYDDDPQGGGGSFNLPSHHDAAPEGFADGPHGGSR